MKNLFYLLILLTIVIYGFQCGHDECEEYIFDTASLDYSINPIQSEFEIGDTITIEYLNGNLVKLHERMTEIDLINQEIRQSFDLFEVKEDNSPITSGTNNILINHNGTKIDFSWKTNEVTRIIYWTCEEANCQLSLKLVPIKSGYYGIRLLYGTLWGESTCEEYQFHNNIFDITDNNFNVLTEIRTDVINIDVPIKFESIAIPEGSFYFKVN